MKQDLGTGLQKMDQSTRIGLGGTALFAMAGIGAPILTWWVSGPIMIACAVVAVWGFRPVVSEQWRALGGRRAADCSVECALNHAAHHSTFSQDDPDKWTTIALAFRQAAQRGDAKVWGQVLIEKGAHGEPDTFSGIEVDIDQTYWERAELDLMTFHLFPNKKADKRDYERAKVRTTQQTNPIGANHSGMPVYGHLKTNRRQMLKLWPLTHEGSPLT
jgi:hypothetical protein